MKRVSIQLLDSLWKNADYLALVVVLQFWTLLTNTPLNLRTALTLAGLCLVYRVYGIVRRDTAALTAPTVEERREFVGDPDGVLELAKLKGYDAVRGLTPYLGKWITISGRFDGIAESLGRDAVHLSLLVNDGTRINLRFSMEHLERLEALREGQWITAVGRIPRFGLVFSPENCELIRVEPVRLAYAC